MTDATITHEALGAQPKRAWTPPQLHEYDLKETQGGLFNVQFEGPYNFVFGDCGSGFLDPPTCS